MFDLAVIGAGPAGMAAALAASASGLRVVVIDEQTRAGGQIFRQPPKAFTDSKLKPTAGYQWAPALIERFERDEHITYLQSTTAYGILRDRDGDRMTLNVAVSGPSVTGPLQAKRILIATGAYDMPVAFPGWTLPGVTTAGAVQSLLKSQRMLADDDFVLVGSHPLLIVVAHQLRAAGARVSEIAFARGVPSPREMMASLGAVPGHLPLLAETASALTGLVAGGVRISPHTIVTAARGDRQVEEVELARVNKRWETSERRRVVKTSTLVLCYGFSPSTELARQAGCDMVWDSPKGGWIVAHDERMATTAAGIFVAGEPTGVAGADQSRAEGHLAGLAIAADLGADLDERAIREAQAEAGRTHRFSRVVQTMFEPGRPGLASLASPETTVCRCELVTRSTIQQTLDANPFISTANAVKLQCRSGMGTCQGRYCEGTVNAIVAKERALPPEEVGHYTAHLPVKPVPLDALAALDLDELDLDGRP